MTTTTLPRLSTFERPLGLFRFLADLAEGVMEARTMTQRYRELSLLSDAELARLGLTRQDVPHAAAFGVGAV